MSILVDNAILKAMADGEIKIEPFDETALGTNSYDVHLARTLRIYAPPHKGHMVLDCRQKKPPTVDIVIPDEGFVLEPGELYLASTTEYTESHKHVPVLNGKSSLGRLGLSIHVTAGFGDVGFCNHWTMELFVVRRLRIYPGMPIGQLYWYTASGTPDVPYDQKRSAKYTERSQLPMASEMGQNFDKTDV